MRELLILGFIALCSFHCVAQQDSLKIQKRESLNQQQLDSIRVDSLEDVVRSFFYEQKYDKAIEKGTSVRSQAKKIQEYETYFNVSSLIGNSFLQLEDTLQARKIFETSLQEAEQKKLEKYIISTRIDLGNTYAVQKNNRKAHLKAIEVYRDAIPKAINLKDTTRLFILNYNIADMFLELRLPNRAESYLNVTSEYGKHLTFKPYQAVLKIQQGEYHLQKNNSLEALEYLNEAIPLARESQYSEALLEGLTFKSKALANLNRFEEAYATTQEMDSLQIEKYQKDKLEAVQSATAQFQLNEYEQALETERLRTEFERREATRETTIFWVLIVAVVLFVFSIFLIIINKKRKSHLSNLRKKNQEYQIEKEKAEKLSKAKNRLFSNISHELRTPLYGIIGITNMLLDNKKLKTENENVKSLKFSADYLLSLVNNILQLNQLDRVDAMQLENSDFNLPTLLSHLIESTKHIETDHKNSVQLILADTVPSFIKGDKVKLAQILMNLLNNAMKFTQNGSVTLSVKAVEKETNRVALAYIVSDTGKGIAKDRLSTLFEEFGSKTVGENYDGTGLGLPLVKKIIALHDADITVESEVGKGTTVQFILWHELGNKSINNDDKEVKNTLSLQNKKILVVDDNKLNLLVTERSLTRYGAKVLKATSGSESIEMVKNEAIDLILMDINMPDMDGFTATEEIRKYSPNIAVVALTAVEVDELKRKDGYSLIDDYLIKPYDSEDFKRILQAHLQKTSQVS